MNKYLLSLVIGSLMSFYNVSLYAQQDDNLTEMIPEEETIGGIGGTGIHSMSRPEILERPERIERPDLLESRDALEDILEVDAALDADLDELERPAQIED